MDNRIPIVHFRSKPPCQCNYYDATTGHRPYNGTAVIPYNLCDPPGECDLANITFVVSSVNDAPVANDDNGAGLTEDGANGTINILSNDTDADGNPTAPTNGAGQFSVDLDPSTAGIQTTLTNATGVWNYDATTGIVTFDPANNYNGTAVIPYNLCDPSGECDLANITFVVSSVNDAPVVDNEYISLPVNGSASGDLTDAGDSDIDGNLVATTTPLNGPSHGSITINTNGTFIYTPTAGYSGNDMVIVQICDDGTPLPANCVNDTIFITILPTNPPIAVNDTTTTLEDTQISLTVTTNDYDTDGNIVISTVDLNPSSAGIQSTFTNVFGTWSVNATGVVLYTPALNFNGVATATYTVLDDDEAISNIATIVINVTPVNDPPIITNEAATINEDTPLVGTVLTAGDSDPDGNTLTVVTTPISGPDNGTITIGSNGTFTYNPNPNFNGQDTIVTSVCDNGTPQYCVNDTLIITIVPVNDAPIFNDTTVTTAEDVPINICIPFADVDGIAPYNVTLSCNDNGSVTSSIVGNTLCVTYTPDANYNGLDTVCINLCDASGACTTNQIFITVTPINDPPIISNETATIKEDTPLVGTVLTAGDTDPDGNTLTVVTIPISGPDNGTITIGSNGTFTYNPNPNFNGQDTIVTSVCDNGTPQYCVNDTLIITVVPVNDAPIFNDTTVTTAEDIPVNICIPFADVDGIAPYNVTLSCNDNGSVTSSIVGNTLCVTYTPDANYNGLDTVCINLCDASGDCTTNQIFITVTPVNDPPIITNEAATINEDTPLVGTVLTAGDTDPDGNTLTVVTIPISGPDNGTITIGSNGTFTYNPNPNFNGQDTIVTSICDNGTPQYCVNDTLIITVVPVNDAPIAVNDIVGTNPNTPVGFNIGTNDFDIDGPSVTWQIIQQPDSGVAVIISGDSIVYTPNLNAGVTSPYIDTLVYTICDGDTPALCDTAIVLIYVPNTPFPPTVVNEWVTVQEDHSVIVPVLNNDYDSNGDPITVSQASGTSTNGTYTVDAGGNLTYTPNLNFNGLDTVVVQICDPTPLCTNDTIFVSVTPINDPLTVANDTAITSENNPVTGDITNGGDYDIDGSILTVNTNPISGPTNGDIAINSDGTFTYTPDADFNGIDTIVFEVCDGGIPTPVTCKYDTLFVIVNPVNDPPIVNDTTTTTLEDVPVTICIPFIDSDGLTPYTATLGCMENGTATVDIVGNTACVTYTSNSNYNGNDTICMTLCDAGGMCTTSEIVVTITPVNDMPTVNNDTAYTLVNTPVSGNIIGIGDTDPDGTTLIANTTPVSGPSNGTITVNADGSFTYAPNNGFIGTDTVVVEVCDQGLPVPGICLNDTLFIVVTSNNIAPIANPDYGFTKMAVPVTINLINNDSDPDGTINIGSMIVTQAPSHGSVQLFSDGTAVYTPNSEFVGTDKFIYRLSDNDPIPLSDTALVTIVVKPLDLVVPDGFSPNGDGVNDQFVINGLEKYPNCSIEIFNRWGNKVYSASPYLNDWDGTSNINSMTVGGEKLPTGTYYYLLNFGDDNTKSVVGFIAIQY